MNNRSSANTSYNVPEYFSRQCLSSLWSGLDGLWHQGPDCGLGHRNLENHHETNDQVCWRAHRDVVRRYQGAQYVTCADMWPAYARISQSSVTKDYPTIPGKGKQVPQTRNSLVSLISFFRCGLEVKAEVCSFWMLRPANWKRWASHSRRLVRHQSAFVK